MALQGKYPNPHHSQTLPQAYVLVGDANFTLTQATGKIAASVYHDKSAYQDGLPPLDTVAFVPGQAGFPSLADIMAMPVPAGSNMGQVFDAWLYPVLNGQPPFTDMRVVD
jgi:hypothetical protein